MKKLGLALLINQRRSGSMELANFFCIVVSAILAVLIGAKSLWWLIVISAVSDAIRFALCGYWYLAPFHRQCHKWSPQKDMFYKIGMVLKFVFYALAILAAVVIALAEIQFVARIGVISAYAITTISLFEALRTLAHVLQKHNRHWLDSANGHFGPLEQNICFAIILCVINAHLIATEFFGPLTLIIAWIIVLLYIFIVELANYYIWQYNEPATTLYGWGDHASRKVFFFCHFGAIIIAMVQRATLKDSVVYLLLAAAVAVAKDIFEVAFHLNGMWDINYKSVKSYYAETARRWAIYLFVATGLIAIYANSSEAASIALILMILISAVSIYCAFCHVENRTDDEEY